MHNKPMKYACLVVPCGAACALDLVLQHDDVLASNHDDAFYAWEYKYHTVKSRMALIDLVGTSFDLLTLPTGGPLSEHKRTRITISIVITRSNP